MFIKTMFESSSLASRGVIIFDNLNPERNMNRQFESRGTRKISNFVPSILDRNPAIKMVKTLDFSRVFRVGLFCYPIMEAPPRIELGIRALQAPALPLGHGAGYLS